MIRSQYGESVKQIFTYWWPELISVALLVYMPPILDMYLIASLKSTSTFAALDVTSNMLHTLIKFSEAIPVAAIAIIGRYNGAKEYKRAGQGLSDTFWTTLLMGSLMSAVLFFGASTIYQWYGVPDKMVALGVPFLRLRSLGLLLAFVFHAFLGFLKGVKNTRVPMMLNIIGTLVFVVVDYVLILGKAGFEPMGLLGSAVASILQFSIMILGALWYIFSNTEYKKYFDGLFLEALSYTGACRLLRLSWPIIIDKTSLSLAYVWLGKLIAPMGKYAMASYGVIKNLERFAFLPALAFAQIITFLVSNRLGAQDPQGAKANIKKVLFFGGLMVGVLLIILCTNAHFFVGIFDHKGKYVDFAAQVLPFISSLVIFDLVQVILAGSLRGAGDVKTVMFGRFFVCFGIFMPLSYALSLLPIESVALRFTLLYVSFYVSNMFIGLIFFLRLRGDGWQKKSIE